MNSAAELIRDEIARHGPISFARFMELALYAQGVGYYERQNKIGRRGDFYTSVSVGPLFGELLAFQFADWLGVRNESSTAPSSKANPKPPKGQAPSNDSQILEAGAHDGRLAKDILTALRRYRGELFEHLEYWVLEPSVKHQEWQKQTLAEFRGKVRWFGSWEDFGDKGVHGIIFSNELLDAMPVHCLKWDDQRKWWTEMKVDWADHRCVWKVDLSRKADVPLSQSLGNLETIDEGALMETCPAAAKWWQAAASVLRHGKLLTIDYGIWPEEAVCFPGTSVRAYFRHGISDDVLANPGEQDITANVNFSELQRIGEAAGLKTEAMISQEKFLTRIVADGCKTPQTFSEWNSKRTAQFQTLTHPQLLGHSFKVLVQSR